MAKPYDIARQFEQLTPNLELLERLRRKHQKAYIRLRIDAIRMLWQGYTREEVVKHLHVARSTLIIWLHILIDHGVDTGLELLTQSKKVPHASKLSLEQQQELIRIIENQTPADYGYDSNIFSAAILIEIVQQQWGISLSDQSIYNLLHRHGLSHQRAHRDYADAQPREQQAYAETLKKSSKHHNKERR